MQKLIINNQELWVKGKTELADGNIISSNIAISQNILIGVNTVTIAVNTKIYFHLNHKIKRIKILTRHKLTHKSGKIKIYKKNSFLNFDEQGNLL